MAEERAERSKLNVFVRCRPHLSHDVNQEPILSFPSKNEVIVNDDVQRIQYKFDHVFPADDTPIEVFENMGEPLVSSVLSGVSSCLMAYGQSSTGKTYNMFSEQFGLVHLSIEKMFEMIKSCSKYNYNIIFSFLQIYQDRIYDLLARQSQRMASLSLREHPKEGVIIEGLSEQIIENLNEAEQLLKIGKEKLITTQNSKTLQLQSRSHAICIIKVEKWKKQVKFENPLDRIMTKSVKGRLFMCDLAGSERLNRTGFSRRHIEEARYINTSLLELGNVIHALTSRSNLYVPFRNSTLTRILKESLGGNSKATLMVCVSPAASDLLETKYSLNFGQRAMKIVKHTITNVESRTDSHWLNYPLFRRRRSKKIDYRKLAEYLTNKLKELEISYGKEKENLRHLKRKLAKRRSDFFRSRASESQSESNESTPSKILTTRTLSVLVEESISKEVTHRVKDISTQTLQPEMVSCHTSNPFLFDKLALKAKLSDKAIGTSRQSIFQESYDELEHKSVYTSFQSTNILHSSAVANKSANTSLQSLTDPFCSEMNKSITMSNRSTNTSLQSLTDPSSLSCFGMNKSSTVTNRSVNTSLQSLTDPSSQFSTEMKKITTMINRSVNTSLQSLTDPSSSSCPARNKNITNMNRSANTSLQLLAESSCPSCSGKNKNIPMVNRSVNTSPQSLTDPSSLSYSGMNNNSTMTSQSDNTSLQSFNNDLPQSRKMIEEECQTEPVISNIIEQRTETNQLCTHTVVHSNARFHCQVKLAEEQTVACNASSAKGSSDDELHQVSFILGESIHKPTQFLAFSPITLHEFFGDKSLETKDDTPSQGIDEVDCGVVVEHLSETAPEALKYKPQSPKMLPKSHSANDLTLVNFTCNDADSDISLREAKILKSPKEPEVLHSARSVQLQLLKHPLLGQMTNIQPSPISPMESYPYPSFESETERIYHEDTRYARKSLRKAQNRYSTLLQQLEDLTSKGIFIQDGSDSSDTSDGDCYDIILKFKSELEGELNRSRSKLNNLDSSIPIQHQETYSFGTAKKSTKNDDIIKCLENSASNVQCSAVDPQSVTGSTSGSDQTPSGMFDDDFIKTSMEINNNSQNIPYGPQFVNESPKRKLQTQSSGRMEEQTPSSHLQIDVSRENIFEGDEQLSPVNDEKFLKQRKLTIAAIENAEIKKELLLTKLEKLRLEAVLSCVLIDTESNDMTKEFQQLSMRSMKCLTSSKSTLASTASCAHLPSATSPITGFKSLQSPIKKYNYRERFIGGEHIINDVKQAGKISLADEPRGVTRSVQTEQNVVNWLNTEHVTPKKPYEEGSYESSSDFDVSSISDLGSPLLMSKRLSPCGQDTSPYSPNDFLYDTDLDDVDKLLMRYKKKKTSSFSLSCFPFTRNKKQRLRNDLQTGNLKLESSDLSSNC